ncbi:MAG: biotin--[acetyl-CoA-carboxylase] ligase [Verrucomicrobia bacterium A1]|nr:MAG: biotin--[acetyl-CoA-carboxylase] ligase [Verrucomicrobia bacterium A1]
MDLTADIFRADLLQRLGGGAFGLNLEVHPTLPSTQDRAKELAVSGAPEGTCVLALEQSRGRGRMERTWRSDRGKGLYLSVVLRPPWPAQESAWLSIVAALAVARALDRLGVRGARIKAPNDVYVGARKIAGVLVEPRLGADRIEFAVVGIGLNVAHGLADWQGTDLDDRATSCAMEGAEVPLVAAAKAVLAALDELYRANRDGRADALAAEWTARGGTPEVPGGVAVDGDRRILGL